jgi:hypothetical protein
MKPCLRLFPLALLGAAVLGCVDQPAPIPAAGSRQAAPEIKGVDSEGKELALRDYRGKVVLVDFWKDG